VAVPPVAGSTGETTIEPGQRASVRYRLPPAPWALPRGFVPLGVVLARIGEQVWTRESGFREETGR
jgi:hypothetical protein